jgi:hypothetical protein
MGMGAMKGKETRLTCSHLKKRVILISASGVIVNIFQKIGRKSLEQTNISLTN